VFNGYDTSTVRKDLKRVRHSAGDVRVAAE